MTGGVPDPVGAGFAQSLRRPGGNITGLSFGLPETAEIVMALLKALRPGLRRLGALFAKGTPPEHRGPWWAQAGRAAGLEWSTAEVATDEEAERALESLAGQAAIVAPMRDPAFGERVVAIATRLRSATVLS